MNIAAALAAQSVPFAGLVLAGRENTSLFTVLYVGALGMVVSLIVLSGDHTGYAASFLTEIDAFP